MLHIFLMLSLVAPVVGNRAKITVGNRANLIMGPEVPKQSSWSLFSMCAGCRDKDNLPRDETMSEAATEAANAPDNAVCCWGPQILGRPETVKPFVKKGDCHKAPFPYHVYKAPNACCERLEESGVLKKTAPPICFTYDQALETYGVSTPWHVVTRSGIMEEHLPDENIQNRCTSSLPLPSVGGDSSPAGGGSSNESEGMLANGPQLERAQIMSILSIEIIRRVELNGKGHQVPDEATFRTFLQAQNIANGVPANLQDIHTAKGSVFVIGDIHAQLNQLQYVMDKIADIVGDGFDYARGSIRLKCHKGLHYVFLGDYLDRGDQDVEVVALLLAYRAMCPPSKTHGVHLLRGNHEDLKINAAYGFQGNWELQYKATNIQLMGKAFTTLPYAAVLNDEVFLVHGGLPEHPDREDFGALTNIAGFKDWVNSFEPVWGCGDCSYDNLPCQMMWSDPDMTLERPWDDNPRGLGNLFGPNTLDNAQARCGIKLTIRGHQVPKNKRGYFGQFKILTVFTAANYCSTGNIGAFVEIKNGRHLEPHIHEHQVNPDGSVEFHGSIPWVEGGHNESVSILKQSLRQDLGQPTMDRLKWKAREVQKRLQERGASRETLDSEYQAARQAGFLDSIRAIQLSSLNLSAACEGIEQDRLQEAVQSELAKIIVFAEADGVSFADRAVLVADEIGEAAPSAQQNQRLLLICFSEALLKALEGGVGASIAERHEISIAEAYKKQLLIFSEKTLAQNSSYGCSVM